MRNHADAVISHSTVCNKAANSVYRSPKFYISGACLRINTLRHGVAGEGGENKRGYYVVAEFDE